MSSIRTRGRPAVLTTEQVRDIKETLARGSIDHVIFTSSYHLDGAFRDLEQACRQTGAAMCIISPEVDQLFSIAKLGEILGIPIYLPKQPGFRLLRLLSRRISDVILSLAAILLTLPIWLLAALAIRLESPGPILFTQRRSLVAGGPSFNLFKFRSMRDGAESERHQLEGTLGCGGPLFKMKEDPRVTKAGHLLRRFSIDELPQLINVLKGEMSLVGPRPLPMNDFECVRPEDHLEGYLEKRAQVKPGMTGLWQVSGRSQLGFREMLLLDLYYIESQSLFLDFKLLMRTIPAVLFGRGAY